MSRKLLYICGLLVLTKTYIFKKLITITLFFALVLMLFGSFTTPFPVPLWITFLESADGNIHTCHRKDYLEFTELVNCDEPIHEELEYQYNYYDYKIWEKKGKFENFVDVDDLWQAHPNYIPSLDKYCYDR